MKRLSFFFLLCNENQTHQPSLSTFCWICRRGKVGTVLAFGRGRRMSRASGGHFDIGLPELNSLVDVSVLAWSWKVRGAELRRNSAAAPLLLRYMSVIGSWHKFVWCHSQCNTGGWLHTVCIFNVLHQFFCCARVAFRKMSMITGNEVNQSAVRSWTPTKEVCLWFA